MARRKNKNPKPFTEETGWPQFNIQKLRMVCEFRLLKDLFVNRPTPTDKGRHAEELFRKWLQDFLPAKYGVTSGYIITQRDTMTPRSQLKNKLRHFDVIIYNRLEAPVLWTESSSDRSPTEIIRAIPAEYVHAVLEIKSTFNEKNITNALKKLNELTPLLNTDEKEENYKYFLPKHLFLGIIFFELPKSEQENLELLNKLMPTSFPRGLYGGIILSAEGIDDRNTGRFTYRTENKPRQQVEIKGQTLVRSGGPTWSDSIEKAPGEHCFCTLGWVPQYFAIFAFDLIKTMDGTYDSATASSLYGLTFLKEDVEGINL